MKKLAESLKNTSPEPFEDCLLLIVIKAFEEKAKSMNKIYDEIKDKGLGVPEDKKEISERLLIHAAAIEFSDLTAKRSQYVEKKVVP